MPTARTKSWCIKIKKETACAVSDMLDVCFGKYLPRELVVRVTRDTTVLKSLDEVDCHFFGSILDGGFVSI